MDKKELRALAKSLRRNADDIDRFLGPPDGRERGCFWPANDGFPYGTRVRTTSDAGGDDWTTEGRLKRKWGVEGVVIDRSDSHGLCYRVQYLEGSDGWFDPTELLKI